MAIISKDIKVNVPGNNNVAVDQDRRIVTCVKVSYNVTKGCNEYKRRVIGHLAEGDDTMMYPTQNYKLLFPEEWEKETGEKPRPLFKCIGMYSLVKAIDNKDNIISLVQAAFGEANANKILDAAICSLPGEMKIEEQVLFNDKICSEAEYALLFQEGIADGEVFSFKEKWLGKCRESGVSEAWIVLGSTDNVIYSYTVSSTGMPLTFDLLETTRPDLVDIQKTIAFLGTHDVKVAGIFLDAAICDKELLDSFEENNLGYMITRIESLEEYKKMVENHGRQIRMAYQGYIPGTGLLAIQEPVNAFDVNKENYMTIFYDYTSALESLGRYMDELDKLPSDERPSLEEQQRALDFMGMKGVVTSASMRPKEINDICLANECFKYPLGATAYGNSIQSLQSQMLVSFVGAIIQYEAKLASRQADMSYEDLIEELNDLVIMDNEGIYVNVQRNIDKLLPSLAYFGVDESLFQEAVRYENTKYFIVHEKDSFAKERLNKPGVPKGTKRSDFNKDGTPRKKPGVKPGTKRSDTNKDGSMRRKPGPKPRQTEQQG